jgi:tetratricopeptide (TPR) repeat protein
MTLRLPILLTTLCALCLGAVPLPAAEADQPRATLERAWDLYRLGEFNLAIEKFQELRKNARPGTEYDLQGLYGEAASWNFRRDARNTNKALAAYGAIIESAPDHPLAAWAALDCVRAQFLGKADVLGPRAEEVNAYRQVWRRYPETPAGQEAFVFQLSLRGYYLSQTGDRAAAEEALREAEEFIRQYPQSVLRSQVYGAMAGFLKILGRPQERVAYMIRSLEAREFDAANPHANKAGIYWNLAYTAEFEAGDFAIARKYYSQIITEYPQDLRVFPSREALKRLDAVEAAVREGREIPAELIPGGPRP